MSLTLEESAAIAGGLCWVERGLFQRLGAAVAPSSTAQVKVLLDRHSQHAAWRAEQWWDRLPVLTGVERDDLVKPPARWAAALEKPAGSDDPPASDVTRLAVAYRVLLPRLAVAYDHHIERVSPVAEGPVRRTLGQVIVDVRADWAEGEARLQKLIDDAETTDAAAAAVASVERLFVG